jgi:hypothetical protein
LGSGRPFGGGWVVGWGVAGSIVNDGDGVGRGVRRVGWGKKEIGGGRVEFGKGREGREGSAVGADVVAD